MRRSGSRLTTTAGPSLLVLTLTLAACVPLRQPVRDDPLVALGRRLFFDTRLSAGRDVACATCHQPTRAFTDGRPLAMGTGGHIGTRNTPTLLGRDDVPPFGWDGRRDTLLAQVLDPFVDPREHGLSSPSGLLDRIRADPTYVDAFEQTFPEATVAIDPSMIARALVAFIGSIHAPAEPIDRALATGDLGALEPEVRRGLTLFRGVAGCQTCHAIDASTQSLSDRHFHRAPFAPDARHPDTITLMTRLRYRTAGAQYLRGLESPEAAELGRFLVTLDPADVGTFRTPSLRHVASTPPYFHDGRATTLAEALDIETRVRDTPPLAPEDRAALLAFLHALR